MANSIEMINRTYELLLKIGDLYNEEAVILDIEKTRYTLIYNEVHKGNISEAKKIEILKQVIEYDMPISMTKANEFAKKLKGADRIAEQYFDEWSILYDGFYALASYRSLEHFVQYMELDKDEKDKIWEYSIDPFKDNGYSGSTKGFFYYANKMVIEDEVDFIMKQMPTGYGKSYSDSMLISFILGIDKSKQIVKVVGNRSLVSKCTRQVVNIMKNKRYIKVFPEYADMCSNINGKIEDQIYDSCTIKDGMFTIKECGRDTSFECFSKDCERDGIRCDYLFLDDIVQRKETLKIDKHQNDIKDFDGTWKKRCRDEYHFKIIVGGTTYDPYDILCVLKHRYGGNKLKKSKINKYTSLSENGRCVFVCVPKLDENDEPTFPHKCKKENILKDRENDYELFMAMDMQQPVIPKEYPFYWDYLTQYDFIPDDCSDFCYASLDPARTGSNYVSMAIFKLRKERLDNGCDIIRYYLVDCFYEKCTMDNAYNKICALVSKHNIIRLHIEKNTDTSLANILNNKLLFMGITYCEISEVYSTVNKETRIFEDENIIKKQIVFPRRDMYSNSSMMGNFMTHIISYKYKGADYDDSIDAVCLFIDKFIKEKYKLAKPKILSV